MPYIYLVRHGAYVSDKRHLPGRLPVPLSGVGINQAEKLRDYFQKQQIGMIYSSAVKRCKQTAQIIANNVIPIRYDVRILEALSAYQGYWGENWHGDGYHFFSHAEELGGETLHDIQERMVDFFKDVSINLSHDIVVVGHSDPLHTLWCYLSGLPLPDNNKPRDRNLILDYGEVHPIKIGNDQDREIDPIIKQSELS